MKEKKHAKIKWDCEEKAWVLKYYRENEGWIFSNAWRVKSEGTDEITQEPIDFIRDSVLCYIAELQIMGYDVEVRV